MGRVSGGRRRVVGAGSVGGDGSQAHGTRDGRRTSVQQHWPEGSHADPDAARERYNLDVRASHSAMRNLFRVELPVAHWGLVIVVIASVFVGVRSEEHTSELQSRENLVCRLLLEKK